jgi:FtsP/CotA-like multicopper oxidase with cupredoxin domain
VTLMPSEMIEFSSELLVWLVLGVLCFSLAANTGAVTFQASLQYQLHVLAGFVADNVNIAGSRRVEVTIHLPDSLDGHTYTIRTQAYTAEVESESLRATRGTRYPMSAQVLQPGRSYLIRTSDTIAFNEVDR